jgi:DNA-binding NarL/FixJ family response regulator
LQTFDPSEAKLQNENGSFASQETEEEHMELSNHIDTGANGRFNQTATADREELTALSIFIVSRSYLAAQYLMLLLQRDAKLRSVPFEHLRARIPSASCPVFIFDNSCLPVPLGECLRRLQTVHSTSKHVVIDSKGGEETIAQMLTLGVHGFVEHERVATTLNDAVHTVIKGRFWAPPEALQTYIKDTVAKAHLRAYTLDNPTPRERQVLELVKQRFTNKEISKMLCVRESTIKFHLSNIYSKLQVDSRRQLADSKQTPFFWSAT